VFYADQRVSSTTPLESRSTTSRTSGFSGAEAPAVGTKRANSSTMPDRYRPRWINSIRSHFCGDQPHGIGAVGELITEYQIATGAISLHRRLPIGCSVTNIFRLRANDLWILRAQSSDDSCSTSSTGVVCVKTSFIRAKRRGISSLDGFTSHLAFGTWPMVPITSGLVAWPINRMWRSSASGVSLAVDLADSARKRTRHH
jgi:hypothetical protein